MSARTIDKMILAGCTVLAAVFIALGFVFVSLAPIFVILGGFVFYQGAWTWLHNETLRKDMRR